MSFSFVPISEIKKAAIKSFECGNKDMDFYFHRFALKNHKADLSPCFVLYGRDSEHVCGYFTLSNTHVKKEDLPEEDYKKFPRYPIPVTLIGRLAIDKGSQGQGHGRHVLMHIYLTHARAVKHLGIGSVGLITDAIDEDAVKFYAKYDFVILDEKDLNYPRRMFLPNGTIFDCIPPSKL